MASFVDPAMADNGKLYPAFDTVFVQRMKGLCFSTDYILPNLTEDCLLADIPYPAVYDESFIIALLKNLEEKGANKIILTGIGYSDSTIGVVIYEKGQQ